jgi:enoyl-CoA hydratase/carnithine racemase
MSFETIALNVDGAVATLVLNRPERMNALSDNLKSELGKALDVIEQRRDVNVLIITGAGEKAFCAGADIKERSETDPTAAEFITAQRRTHALFNRIAHVDRPVIAAINGAALGGGMEIALCCDIRVAADTAKLGLTEVNLGVIPAGGGTQRLPRLIGAGRAKRLIMTGAVLSAAESAAIGLVDEVVPTAELAERAHALAEVIAAKSPLAVRLAKRCMDQGSQTDLKSALEYELYAASILYASEDRKEGMRAFLEKRTPVFKGR